MQRDKHSRRLSREMPERRSSAEDAVRLTTFAKGEQRAVLPSPFWRFRRASSCCCMENHQSSHLPRPDHCFREAPWHTCWYFAREVAAEVQHAQLREAVEGGCEVGQAQPVATGVGALKVQDLTDGGGARTERK